MPTFILSQSDRFMFWNWVYSILLLFPPFACRFCSLIWTCADIHCLENWVSVYPRVLPRLGSFFESFTAGFLLFLVVSSVVPLVTLDVVDCVVSNGK